jgi:hypothetical protein
LFADVCSDYRRQKKNATRKDFSGAAIGLSRPRDKIRQRDKIRTTREIQDNARNSGQREKSDAQPQATPSPR